LDFKDSLLNQFIFILSVTNIWYQQIISLSGMENISGNINLIWEWRAEHGGNEI